MIKIFLDTCDLNAIKEWEPKVQGFTTNPSLARKAGVIDYEKFCKEVLTVVNGKPVSFEVFADEFDEMERQARIISGWGDNVYVKIPIMNTQGDYSYDLIEKLLKDAIKLNVTAVMSWEQTTNLPAPTGTPWILSVFSGRIADSGIDPNRTIREIRDTMPEEAEILWASPREVFNIYEAEKSGADIITCTPELIEKYETRKGRYPRLIFRPHRY